jgi:hypothetical protein
MMRRVWCAGLFVAMPLLPLVASGTAAAARPARPAPARLVLSPRPGQVVRSNAVRIRLRAPAVPGAVQARLNGVRIGDDLILRPRTLRTLTASISHGLRHGRNVLGVTVRRGARTVRRVTVRFQVRTGRPLIGAGRDRSVIAGQRVTLRGRVVAPATMRSSARRIPSRWRLVSGPRPARGARAAASGPASVTPALASLTSPAGLTAGFTPVVPGRYTLQFTSGTGAAATSDQVTLDAIPPSPMVGVDTMSMSGSTPGVTVNGTFYPLPGGGGRMQVLVFDRTTLGFVSNTAYHDAYALDADLARLDDTSLVIVSQRIEHSYQPEGPMAEVLTKRLGFPNIGGPISTLQWVSGIGVPGMAPGEANVNISEFSSGDAGEDGLKGYLSRDQYLDYSFVPSAQVPFRYVAPADKVCDPQTQDCSAGYQVKVQAARTLGVYSDRFYATDDLRSGASSQNANRMADDLNDVRDDRLVTIRSVSNRVKGQSLYVAPVGKIDKATMAKLARAVARLGGTRNAFNTTALQQGSRASGGLTYSLVGWSAAGEGVGAESASGMHGAPSGTPANLSGTLRPDRQSSYRPMEVTKSPDDTGGLAQLVYAPPTKAWPLDDDPGAHAAILYLASTDSRLGDNPRVAYWYAGGDAQTWDNIASKISSQTYPAGASFTEEDFKAAKAELVKEMGWVGKVRTFMTDLSKPFSTSAALNDWVATQTIADSVWTAAKKPEGDTTLRWLDFASILAKIGEAFTGDATGVIAGLMELGVWAAGDESDGTPGDGELQVEAHALGAEFVSQAQGSVRTFDRMGDVIVSDYAKLSQVGRNANCLPSAADCPKEYQSTPDDQTKVEAASTRAIQAMAYEKLVPLGFHVYQLNQVGPKAPKQFRTAPPDVRSYTCDVGYHPFYDYGSAPQASTSLLTDADPAGQNNGYQTLVMSVPPGRGQYGTAPPKTITDRMFGKRSTSNDPTRGGLGIDPQDFMSGAKLYGWWNNGPANDPCWWGPLFGAGSRR